MIFSGRAAVVFRFFGTGWELCAVTHVFRTFAAELRKFLSDGHRSCRFVAYILGRFDGTRDDLTEYRRIVGGRRFFAD